MSTVLSSPFSFAEVSRYTVRGRDAKAWKPGPVALAADPRDPPPPRVVTDRWIYAFEVRGKATVCEREYFADKKGQLFVLGEEEARTVELTDPRPNPTATNGATLRLPATINGGRVLHWFLVTRIRLPKKSIVAFEANRPPFIPLVDLGEIGNFIGFETFLDDVGTAEVDFFLPTVDPLTIAAELLEDYQNACNAVIAWTMPYKGQGAQQLAKLEQRTNRYLLATLLRDVLANDKEDDLDLRDDFSDGTGAIVDKEIKAYEAERDKRLRHRDRAAIALCSFIDTKCFDLLREAYRSHVGTSHFHAAEWLAAAAPWYVRLVESEPGKTYLAKKLADPDHLINEYALRQTPAPKEVFDTARKQLMTVVQLWEAISPVAEKLLKKTLQVQIHESVNLVLLDEVLTFQTRTQTANLRLIKGFDEVTGFKVTFAHLTLTPKFLQTTDKALKRLAVGVELVNAFLALKGTVDAVSAQDPSARAVVFSIANLLGSMADTTGAIHAAISKGVVNATIARIAIIGAVMDMACAGDAAVSAYQTNDFDNMVGHGIVIAGSALSAWGAYLLIGAAGAAGAPPAAAGLALAGALVSAAGWIVVLFSKDTDVETFVAHCCYGRAFGKGSASAKWAGGAFSQWKTASDGMRRQVLSLYRLLAAFRLTHVDAEPNAVKIFPGMIGDDSLLVVTFTFVYRTTAQHPSYRVHWGSRRIKHESSKHVSSSHGEFGKDGDGRRFVIVRHPLPMSGPLPPPQVDVNDFDWDSGARPPQSELDPPKGKNIIVTAHVKVQLDMAADGTTLVPVNPALKELFADEDQDEDDVSSKDF